jgi:competence protein ComEC
VNTQVLFLDVGQGDSTVAMDLEAKACVVIDCPAGAVDELARLLDNKDGVTLTTAIISHSDIDHMAGIVTLTRKRRALEVRYNHDRILPADPAARTRWKAALRALSGLEDDGTQTGAAVRGTIGNAGVVHWSILSPTHGMVSSAQVRGQPNHASAVVKIDIGGTLVLVGGDADADAWRRLIDAGTPIGATVFRLPHHGGSLGVSVSWDELLQMVQPDIAVLSVSTQNQYGHPSLDALQSVQRRARSMRTLCTEINRTCLGDRGHPHAAINNLPALSKHGLGGRPGAARCAGTIAMTVNDRGWSIVPTSSEHRLIINHLSKPMCVARG